MSDLEHQLPPRAPKTSAAMPSTEPPQDWRTTTQLLLWVLAIAATLPRLLGVTDFLFDRWSSLGTVLRFVGYVADVVVIVVVARLAPLDQRPEGRAAAGLRQLTFAVLITDFLWNLTSGVVIDLLPSVLVESRLVLTALFVGVGAAADLVFALWLARLLSIHKVQAFLPAVIIIVAIANIAQVPLGLPRVVWAGVNLALVVAVVVEVLRVRRALA